MQHQEWIDRLKGLGIILVVLGHAVGCGGHITSGVGRDILFFLYKYIYLFHMPLFFLIAGLTFSSKGKCFISFAISKALRLLVPYFIFGCFSIIVYLMVMSHAPDTLESVATDSYYISKTIPAWWIPFVSLLHAGGWPNGNGFIANSVLWFLPCLFVLELVGFGLEKIATTVHRRLLFACICCYVAFLIRKYVPVTFPWGGRLVVYYLTFFLVGRSLPPSLFVTVSIAFKTWFAVILMLLLGACCLFSPDPYLGSIYFGWYIVFTGFAFLGCCVAIVLAHVLPNYALVSCGISTMGIMLLHKFPLLALQLKVPFVSRLYASNNAIATCLITFFVTCIAIVFCVYANRLIVRFAPWMLGQKNRK